EAKTAGYRRDRTRIKKFMFTANEIRQKYLQFFASKGHTIVRSDSVVPKDDPTVLFTTAGMQQFKRQFLGYIEGYTRATSSQKCIRTDDLDKVGKTAVHHTFFEMLGNFSFGDYFKKEAIAWAWEFLTKEMKLPADKLWVSVYKDDREAEEIWLKDIKIPADKLVRLGDKSNFWPSNAKENGPNGPCGPCSEIFYDYGVNPNCPNKEKCDPDCSCGRFSEVWNLVFTQFNRKDGGVLEPLPSKNIDTGMGLERLVAVVQGKKNNYETDLFEPILKAITKLNINPSENYKRLIIADHIRAIVFAINDGVIPSNKERGSVVKKLIVESTDIALRSMGTSQPVIYRLVPTVVELMRLPYPELIEKMSFIQDVVKKTEEAYINLLNVRIPELEKKISEIKVDNSLNDSAKIMMWGKLKFNYRDTYGLTLQSINDAFQASKIDPSTMNLIDQEFETQMGGQRQRSRASSKLVSDVFTNTGLDLKVVKTQFVGYESFESPSQILRLLRDNQIVEEIGQGDEVKVILDKTPFYAESGGQMGDTGTIQGPSGLIRVTDTQKQDDIYFHRGIVENGKFRTGDQIQAKIDGKRRLSIMRNHTATHLLQAALRKVLGTHVQQQGSLVAEDRLRFDFTHPQAVTKEQIAQIEDFVNESVLSSAIVGKQVMSIDEAKKSGALAFFAEKYGEKVRVVSIDGYSKEFCGGTHLNTTGQIGLLKIISEGAIAQGVRRLEAKTGEGALQLIKQQEDQLRQIATVTKASAQDVVERVNAQAQRVKYLEKELEEYRFESIKNTLQVVVQRAEDIHGVKVVVEEFDDADMNVLRKVVDLLKQKMLSTAIVLGSRYEDNAYLLVGVTDDLIKQGIKADEIIQKLAPIVGGRGGGRPQLAQAGSNDPSRIPAALEEAKRLIREKVGSPR
ncbi:MAG: alanine--tRNA ligase, partial [Candidatus Omnitrophica bacterium]|nr:alanine--tRNA ligase [Candidatus Omnitrophota bacterium]